MALRTMLERLLAGHGFGRQGRAAAITVEVAPDSVGEASGKEDLAVRAMLGPEWSIGVLEWWNVNASRTGGLIDSGCWRLDDRGGWRLKSAGC